MTQTIDKILIANRGEIAVRIMRTCREMGIDTVAVYSEVDRKAAHVLVADEAVCIGPSEARLSYLNMDAIVEAARKAGAGAIHPGYGFLAENADFAERCEAEGLVFIGPGAEVIRLLGDKRAARKRLSEEGLPIIPGTLGGEASLKELEEATLAMGYPVVVKAAAGGGGKGMRTVSRPAELEAALASAAGEALAAFGSGDVYIEKYLEAPRHIEVQVLADTHGNVIHLIERECSAQRRHQKIVEECPSPVVDEALRKKMGDAAVMAAKAVGYTNAGTFEFLVDREKNFYFLEVNTRLQVEHPVTELVTGIDLVREQIRIAAGEPLNRTQSDITPRGHAVECRIYAEDPANGFMPTPGTIQTLVEPSGPGVRVDSGVYEGWTVPMEYDPILSKLITFGSDRTAATQRMVQALKQTVITGICSPVPFLTELLESETFRKGEVTTDTIDKELSDWKPTAPISEALLAYVAHDLFCRKATPPASLNEQPSPWTQLGAFRI
ncbi:acetyl-CoA carboxylase biotin carboxylase subunit [Desulfoluna limicola]|uniref:Acetyl-CoA carboxylase biotin carboxylase subunit n=1 Tax=Desulfoluna limicola TaxID=2810562 RepID=A0ABN6F798_9BACT|nr:acetyl-CoA carboxylase biotin carboxylase subunit [Desulfoluna limicola]BCS98039.1 acetyl-CoA carboxylase biotin carboxylase subunit [Desulfoluna limicola]